MKGYSRMLVSWLMAGVALGAQAQHTAVKALADGHYLGAKQQLELFLEGTDDEKGRADAQSLLLVCDYVLEVPGTADRMGDWVEAHPYSQYAGALHVFHRNLLVKEARYDEALLSFFADEEAGSSLELPLAYPLSGLSDEACAYNGVLYRMAGERLYDQGEYAQALPYLEAGEKTRTSQYKQGMCYYALGQWEQAWNTLTESAGSSRDEMAQNAWLHAGIAALQRGRKQEAQTAFLNASGMSAKASLREQALYNYSLTLHEQKSPQTVSVMEQFLGEFPGSKYATPVSQCLTEFYMTKKDYSKALQAISKVKSPNADMQVDKQRVLYNLAFQELAQNHVQEALTYATQAIGLGRQDAEAYAESFYVKGDCNYRLGNYAQAANDLNTALNLGVQTAAGTLKNKAYAMYSLGYAQFKLQKYNAAIAQFQKVTELPEGSKSMRADAYNRMGDSYLNMRNYDEADVCYQKAKDVDHSLGDYSMLQQAYIEGLRGNYDKKVELIQLMNAEYAQSSLGAKALYEKGRAYVLQGKTDEAAVAFGELAMQYPGTEYAEKANEELANMAANIAIQDSIAAAQDSIATEQAKAPVLAAQASYDAGEYAQAENLLNKAIDEGISKSYWLARAFILLSDIYKAEGREVEARQTLESLKANYKDDDDIKVMIEERLR